MDCIECHKAIAESKERHTCYYIKNMSFCSVTNKYYIDCPVCKEEYGEDEAQILEKKREKEKEIARNNSKKKRAEVQKNDWKMAAPQLPSGKSQKSNKSGESSSTNSNRYAHNNNRKVHVVTKKMVCKHNQKSLAITGFNDSTTVSGHFGILQAILQPLREYVRKSKPSEEIKHPITKGTFYNSAALPYASISFINEGNHPVDIYHMNHHNLFKLIVDLR